MIDFAYMVGLWEMENKEREFRRVTDLHRKHQENKRFAEICKSGKLPPLNYDSEVSEYPSMFGGLTPDERVKFSRMRSEQRTNGGTRTFEEMKADVLRVRYEAEAQAAADELARLAKERVANETYRNLESPEYDSFRCMLERNPGSEKYFPRYAAYLRFLEEAKSVNLNKE